MPTNFENVKLFMNTFGQEVQEYPYLPSEEVVDLRLDLINEEVGELCEAVEFNDMTEIADALTDILYVTYGMGAALGIDLDKCFEEVHSNILNHLINTEVIRNRRIEEISITELFDIHHPVFHITHYAFSCISSRSPIPTSLQNRTNNPNWRPNASISQG